MALVLIGYTGVGQVDLNAYKYIIIPKTLGEFEKQNQYLTSTLLKHEFVKKGYDAVYEDAFPEDLFLNRCLGLTAVLKDDSTMFRTKVRIVLLDCKGQEVFNSIEGTNKIKEYKEAYKEAIILAMTSFDILNHSYKEKEARDEPLTISFKNDIKSLEQDNTKQSTVSRPKNRSKLVQRTSTLDNQSYKSMEPVASNLKQASAELRDVVAPSEAAKEMLYAKAIPNGYELKDSTEQVQMKLLSSSTENVYIGQADGKSGMVSQKEGSWIFEYYLEGKLVQEQLYISF